jgi:hypothetical protein
MTDDSHDLGNKNATDAAARLSNALNAAENISYSGLTVRDIEHLSRILERAQEAITADDGRGVKDAIVEEDATYICARADEAVAAINGIFLTAERLVRRAEEIREAAAEFRNSVELSGDDNY